MGIRQWVNGKYVEVIRNRSPLQLTHTIKEGLEFYRSQEWKECRNNFLEGKNHVCGACHLDLVKNPKELNVDHIYPIRAFWSKRLDPSNLQILCRECNEHKGNKIVTDLRELGLAVKALRKKKESNKLVVQLNRAWKKEWDDLPDECKIATTLESYIFTKVSDNIILRKNRKQADLCMMVANTCLDAGKFGNLKGLYFKSFQTKWIKK